MRIKRTFELTETDQKNVKILREVHPHLTADVDALRFALSSSVAAIDPKTVKRIIAKLQQQAEVTA